jgi:hypothetical protein
MALLRATVAAAVLLVSATPLAAQAARPSEYQVKAVFLFNFAQFVDWPAEAFADSRAPLVIGVLGEDPFGGFLDQTVSAERLGGRPFEVRRYRAVDEVAACHILFISRPAGERLDEVLASLRNRPILTVSDLDGFAKRGGMIRLLTDKGRIRLEVNLEGVQAAHLTISSKLLRVAEVVTPAGR